MLNAGGYSFPSGHSQIGVNLYGTSALYTKNKIGKAVLWVIVLLIAFSRNVLGVHTPQDVFVGLLIGFLSLYLSVWLMDWIEKEKNNDLIFLGVSLVVISAVMVYLTMKSYPMDYVDGVLMVDPEEMIAGCYGVAGISLGTLSGWILERRLIDFSMDVSVANKVLRAVFGTVVVIAAAR